MTLRARLQRSPLLGFFALTFAWSWACWALSPAIRSHLPWLATLLMFAGSFGPSLAAIVVVWASVDGTIAGIALNPDGSALLSGWIKGKEPAVFVVTAAGRTEVLTKLDGGMFPNGVVRIAAGRFLVADSYKGVIWEVNTETQSASVWHADELLSRGNAADPTPAVNGIKLLGGVLYASNTARQLLLKVPLINGQAGRPEVVLKDIGLDDFDFDEGGVLLGATHVYNSLVRVGRDGKVTVLAGLAQGMAGSTAVAFSAAGGGQVFVTTNGGMSMPPAGGVQTGKVVQVKLAHVP